jgi:hypothetical protein
VSNVLDQAQNFAGGPVAAARQRDRWARQEANATDDERREQYREAIADLEARYPDIAEVPVGGAEAFARERGHGTGARSPVHGGRQRLSSKGKAARQPAPAKQKPASASKPAPRRRSSSPRRAPAGRPTPRVDRAIRQTGIPRALESSGSTTMAALGATVGLSLAYLVISSSEKPGSGAAALPRIIGGVTGVLHRFLGLGDVFPSNRPAASNVGPTYNERPGSNIATAAGRLKAAGRGRATHRDARPGTYGRPGTSPKQGTVHR